MKITRTQLHEYLFNAGACGAGMNWLGRAPADKTPEELWNLCREPHWMWWLVERLESEATGRLGDQPEEFPLHSVIWEIYHSTEFNYMFSDRPTASCNAIREAVPFSKIEDLLVARLARDADPREPFDPDDLDDIDIDDLNEDALNIVYDESSIQKEII